MWIHHQGTAEQKHLPSESKDQSENFTKTTETEKMKIFHSHKPLRNLAAAVQTEKRYFSRQYDIHHFHKPNACIVGKQVS